MRCATGKRKLKARSEAVPEEKTEPLAVSLKTLAQRLDAHRSSVRRWLRRAGIKPIAIGQGPNCAIRYRWEDVKTWLDSMAKVE